jgi:hypothetical protein
LNPLICCTTGQGLILIKLALITYIAKEGYIQLIPQRDIQSIRGIFEGANPENYREKQV